MTAYSQTQKTVMDPYFKRKGIFVIFLIFLTFMVLTNLTNDSVNILTTVLPTLRGWSQSAITLPLSVGGWLAIPVLLITGTLIKRIGAFNCFKNRVCNTGGFYILYRFFPFLQSIFRGDCLHKKCTSYDDVCISKDLCGLVFCVSWQGTWYSYHRPSYIKCISGSFTCKV